jgi:hypothetical protein
VSEITTDQRQKFLMIQAECFATQTKKQFGDARMFMPQNGICWKCFADVVEIELSRGNDGSRLVTGCPNCLRTFCD